MLLRVALGIFLLTFVAGTLIHGRTFALLSDAQAVPNNTFTTSLEFPPAAPTGLVATVPTAGPVEVTLDWNDNTEPDLLGYSVYRSETGGGPYL